MNDPQPPTFRPGVVLAMLLTGALAFLAMLWFIGSGQTGRQNDGGAHAAARGLTGFAGLAAFIEADGHTVRLARNPGTLDDDGLLILTPPLLTDADELSEIIEARRYQGPTMVILPKWYTMRIGAGDVSGAEDGWVTLGGAGSPEWTRQLADDLAVGAKVDALVARGDHWRGLGMTGRLPDPREVMTLEDGRIVPLVLDARGRVLAGYIDDRGYYPVLAEAAGVATGSPDTRDTNRWNVLVVAEPDLFNNYGMADRGRALLAREIIELAMEGEQLDVVFDLTLNGLGGTRNLLTLAFTPPFLAATLCLLLAMFVVAWRALCRFGAPVAEARPIAFGKTRLVANGAAFIQRTGRLHLLGRPYAELIAARLARALGLRGMDAIAIDAALARRAPDAPNFSSLATTLREARGKHETLRAARALADIERTLKK